MRTAARPLVTVAIVAAVAAWATTSMASGPSRAFSFALLGDAPYRDADESRFAAMLEQINEDPSLQFVVHVGDIKGSEEPCSDQLLRRRLAQFDLVRSALVYTPGDNEWTDCHRPGAGRFHPLERLAALRRFAFANPQVSFGRKPLALQSQANRGPYREFVENALFERGGVVFATLHVVGSNNGLEPWSGIDRQDRREAPRADRLTAFKRRQEANRAWLAQAFAHAEATGAVALVLAMQANPRFELAAGSRPRAGFDTLIDDLRRLAHRFGQPVLLAHGDRHLYLVDRPLAGNQPPVPRLRRVQTFGNPWVLWVRIDVDPRRDEVFDIRPGPPPSTE